jgi:hypothetical protein
MDTWQEVIIVAGACSVGVIWLAALAGMAHIGWTTLTSPVTEWLKEKKE